MSEHIIDYLSIGKRIKEKRMACKMTQEQLGEATNLSIAHISHIENGHTKLSVESLINISNALNVNVDELLQDNMQYNKLFYYNDIANIVSDCTPEEIRDLSHILKYFKSFLRKK